MADPVENKDKKADAGSQQDNASVEIKPANMAADMHLPQIIAALHQNAIAKCAGDLGGDYRISNSALNGEGDKATLESAGQHVISVIPAKSGINVKKAQAIKALKTYVSWFVGPDLANKINDSTVKPLDESPGSKKNESVMPFMKFSQFLKEAEGDAEDDGFDPSGFDGDDPKQEKPKEDDGKPNFSDGTDDTSDEESKGNEKTKDGKNDKEKSEDSGVESKLGYYVPYDMKVEGMKQTALKDSMKKFALNFFDDLKITAAGLFGGGDSFTVKDVKDKIRSTFGPIDPDQLVQNVRDRIEKKYKGSDENIEVKVQDKTTLINDIGDFLNGKQKQKIDSADYSLYIQVGQDDPKKDVFNPRIIADIVQSSITGLYKKFKNKVTADDVIYIPDFKDIHDDTDQIRSLYKAVPTPDQIRTEISKQATTKNGTVSTAFSAIQKRLEKILKSKYRKNCKRADDCVKAWEKFNKQEEKNKKDPKTRDSITGEKNINDYFKDFEKEYEKAYKNSEDTNLQESVKKNVSFVISNQKIAQLILESLFAEKEEHDDKDSDKKNNIDVEKAKDEAVHWLEVAKVTGITKDNIFIGEKNILGDKLSNRFVKPEDFSSSSYKYGIMLCKKTSMLVESNMHDDIMHILFEDEPQADAKSSAAPIDDIYKALKKTLEKCGVTDIDSKVVVFKMEGLDESVVNSNALLESKLKDYLRDHKLSKTDALSSDKHIAELKHITHYNEEKVRDKIEKAYDEKGNIKPDEEMNGNKKDTNKEKTEVKASPSDAYDSDNAYVLMFNCDGIANDDASKSENSEGNDGSSDSTGDAGLENDDKDTSSKLTNNLYIIPMPGLKYEDPEYI